MSVLKERLIVLCVNGRATYEEEGASILGGVSSKPAAVGFRFFNYFIISLLLTGVKKQTKLEGLLK